jgi:hypothetical protein
MRLAWIIAVAAFACGGAAFAKDHKKKDKDSEQMVPVGDKGGGGGGSSLNSLTVNCSPPGADVQVDGQKIGVAPIDLPVPVTPGDHTIKVTHLGYAPFLDTFSTKGKKVVKLEVELVPLTGVLHVKTDVAHSRVLIDGRFVGEAGPDKSVDVEMDVGARAIQVEKGCYKDFFQNVMAVAGKEEQLDVKLESLPQDETNPCYVKPLAPAKIYQKPVFWVVGGGAVVVIATAVALGAAAAAGAFSVDPLANADVKYDLSVMKMMMGLR